MRRPGWATCGSTGSAAASRCPRACAPFAPAKLREWTKAKEEHRAGVGYALLGALAQNGPLPDVDLRPFVSRIEKEIHGSPNRARHSMVLALRAIGIARPALRDEVLAAAARIGKVEVDHGETNCERPDIAAYITHAAKRGKKG